MLPAPPTAGGRFYKELEARSLEQGRKVVTIIRHPHYLDRMNIAFVGIRRRLVEGDIQRLDRHAGGAEDFRVSLAARGCSLSNPAL